MPTPKPLLLIILLILSHGISYSQTTDSLNVNPNPFKDSTSIHLYVAKTDSVTLIVYNRYGQRIKTFYKASILSTGIYNIKWVTDSLEDNVYFISLKIGTAKPSVKQVLKNSATSNLKASKWMERPLIYPNPSNNLITVPIEGIKTIIITNSKGKTVKSFSTEQTTLSLSDLAAGQYFITIVTQQTEKITQPILLIGN